MHLRTPKLETEIQSTAIGVTERTPPSQGAGVVHWERPQSDRNGRPDGNGAGNGARNVARTRATARPSQG
jgi:hypothetical protein